MNQHIEKAGLDDLQVVKALGAGGFGLVKLVKVKGQLNKKKQNHAIRFQYTELHFRHRWSRFRLEVHSEGQSRAIRSATAYHGRKEHIGHYWLEIHSSSAQNIQR